MQLLQQVGQVEQVQGGKARDQTPLVHQAAASKKRGHTTATEWGEEGGDGAGQAGGGDDGQPEGPHHLKDDLALWQVQLLNLKQWKVKVEQVQDETPHLEVAHRGWEIINAAAEPVRRLSGVESQFSS